MARGVAKAGVLGRVELRNSLLGFTKRALEQKKADTQEAALVSALIGMGHGRVPQGNWARAGLWMPGWPTQPTQPASAPTTSTKEPAPPCGRLPCWPVTGPRTRQVAA